ncbi:diacylglycerol lipase-alpha-like isoform X2 [Ischnura elegans]|uniref:diacylglycerol lipase-alpha-like isoform X2 n=1 Tax=Ischnura elegans TaxID=197161 RepID=UPI001ED869AF|nr:diacylglycerol lipase-alpha-like isoform X2 [Ischnura elegans]
MPGIVVFGRRWSVGSDDLVVPGVFLFLLHTIWAIALSVVLWASDWDEDGSSVASPTDPTPTVPSATISSHPTIASSPDATTPFPDDLSVVNEFDPATSDPLTALLTPALWRAAAVLGPALTRGPNSSSVASGAATTPLPASVVAVEGDGVYASPTAPATSAGEVDEAVHSRSCGRPLRGLTVAALALTLCALVSELSICLVAMRGSILDARPRAAAEFLIYARLGLMGVELVWLCLGVVWLCVHYVDCPVEVAKEALLGLVISNWCVICSVVITVWCTYDAAGRSWVKMKKYQRSVRDAQQSRFQYKRSGNRNRNWRQRKVIRAYQDSWDHRCRLLFCCMGNSDRSRNSFADIARLLSDFFRDLDVVPSDVIAGLVLLRKSQKRRRLAIIGQRVDGTYDFLSGAAVTSSTKFVALSDPATLESFQEVVHYMSFALAAYGWPMYLVANSASAICSLCTSMRCCACAPCCYGRLCKKDKDQNADPEIVEDNCHCNYAALQKIMEADAALSRRNKVVSVDAESSGVETKNCKSGKCCVDVVYATYHVDVGETPFFVAVDYAERKVIISIRGTLSMKDVITDLNAEGEPLPLAPPREDWLGHKGMVQAAEYIRGKLNGEGILERAFCRDTSRGTQSFGLVLVGHSLGAGTAAILAILMRGEFPGLHCYAYSPPGGLLSLPAVEYTKEFITSVVVGKDVVPRIGLHQLESLRTDLIKAIQQSKEPKWKTITGGVVCCGCQTSDNPSTASSIEIPPMSANEASIQAVNELKGDSVEEDLEVGMSRSRCNSQAHPTDSSIALTVHQPLYPPGRIIHIVRHHPSKGEQVLNNHEPVYQALWANNTDFDEVLISPVMIQDHMPDKVLEALNKVITHAGPAKPARLVSPTSDSAPPTASCVPADEDPECCHLLLGSPAKTPPHRLCLETSFGPEAAPTPSSTVTVKPFLPMCPGTNGHGGLASGSSSSSSYASTMAATATTGTATSPPLAPHPLLSPWEYPSILEEVCQRQSPMCKSPSANQWPPLLGQWSATSGVISPGRVDLVNDDWLGLAPLATPESLSEVSSISSRASLGLVLGAQTGAEVFVTPPCRRGRVAIRSQRLADSLDGDNVCMGLVGEPGSMLPMVTSSSEDQSFESAQSNSSKQVTFDLGDFSTSNKKEDAVAVSATAGATVASSWRGVPRATWKADPHQSSSGSLVREVNQTSASLASPTVSSTSQCSSHTSVSPCLVNGPKVTKYPFQVHSVGQGESSV